MKNNWLLLILLLALSTSLLTLAANQFSFWEDETYIAAQAEKQPGNLLQNMPWDNHPVLPLITFSAWGSWFGYSEIGLRSLSILVSLVSLCLTYILALSLFNQRAALFSVAVLGFMPLFVMFGHNARYYPLAALFSLAVVLALRKYLTKHSVFYLALYILFGVILIYISFGAASVLVACNIWWLVNWLQDRERKGSRFFLWALAQLIIVGLYIPGFLHLFTVVDQYYGVPQTNSIILEPIKRLAYILFTFAVGQTISPLNPLAWAGCLLACAITIFALSRKAERAQSWILALIVSMIILINLLMSFFSPWLSQIWQNLPHWSFYALPFLAILLGVGLAGMKRGWVHGAAIALLLVYGAANYNYFSGRQFLQTMYAVPWREIFTKIQTANSQDSAVICRGSDVACKYYALHFGFEPVSNPARIQPAQYRQVWWVQTNLGSARGDTASLLAEREKIALQYPQREDFFYARQDESIRWLKTTFLGQDDTEYRVEVHRFFIP